MSSDKRSPAKSECLKEEPEVYRVESAGIVPSGNIGVEKIIVAVLVVVLEYAFDSTFYAVCFCILIAFFLVNIFEGKEFIGFVTEDLSCLFFEIGIAVCHNETLEFIVGITCHDGYMSMFSFEEEFGLCIC